MGTTPGCGDVDGGDVSCGDDDDDCGGDNVDLKIAYCLV